MRGKTIFLWFLGGLAVATAGPGPEQRTITQLVQRVARELPKGWMVSYDQENNWVEIGRVESVLSLPALPGQSLLEGPRQRQFAFAFRVVRHMSQSEHRQLKAENDHIEKKAAVLFEELHRIGIPYGKGSFSPETDDHKSAVAPYEELKKSLRRLPDYYFRDISLEWAFPWWTHEPHLEVSDKAIRKECARIESKVLKLLSKYDSK